MGTSLKMTESDPINGLCTYCNINQSLKIRQLGNFIPRNEESFDEEVEEFRIKLDRWYELCDRCEEVLDIKLSTQNIDILKNLGDYSTPAATRTWSVRSYMQRLLFVGSMACLACLILMVIYSLAGEMAFLIIGTILSFSGTVLRGNFTIGKSLKFVLWSIVHCLLLTTDYIMVVVSALAALVRNLRSRGKPKHTVKPVDEAFTLQAIKAAIYKSINRDCFTPSRPVLNENISNSGYNAWHLQFLPVTHCGYPNIHHPPLNGSYCYEFQPPGAWPNYSTFVPPSMHYADLQYAEQISMQWGIFLTDTLLNLVAAVFNLESIIHEWF